MHGPVVAVASCFSAGHDSVSLIMHEAQQPVSDPKVGLGAQWVYDSTEWLAGDNI